MVIAPVAYMSMFTGFHAYDDEGYFLQLFRDYLSGQPLLTPATPIYGPFFFETMGVLFKLLGVAPGHDSGRVLTLVVWLLASLLGGLTAYRMTRNGWLGIGAQLVTFHALAALTTEPMSPSGEVGLLIVVIAFAAAFRSAKPRLTAVVIGAAVAALCLVKINVGGFAAVAVAFAWAASLPIRWRRSLLPVALIAMVAFPLILTGPLFGVPWVLEFAIVTVLAAAAIGVTCLRRQAAAMPPAAAWWLITGAAALTVICLGVAVAGGTRPGDVWNLLVVVSLRFPHIFTWPLRINVGYDVWAALSLAAAAVVAGRRISPVALGALAAATGVFTWITVLLLPVPAFLLALPWSWVAMIAPDGDAGEPVDRYARVLLPALAVIGSLQAYPVAGTQLSLAALPLVFVGAICLRDGIRSMQGAALKSTFAIRLADGLAPVTVVIAVQLFLLTGFLALAAFADAAPLGLPGAQAMRLPSNQAAELRATAAAIDADCSAFITYPGMNSFYLWTNQKPPTDSRSGIWMITFDAAQQQALVNQLDSESRLCVVKDQAQIEFWSEGQQIADRTLVQFIDGSFIAAGTFGDYELLVRRQD